MRVRSVAVLLSLWALALMGCEGPLADENHPPIARLSVDPLYVPAGTPTTIHLDASRSCDELDHPEGCATEQDGLPRTICPGGVRFNWEMGGDFQVLSSKGDGAVLDVRLTTDEPVEVILRVTDCDGSTSVVRRWIGVTIK